MVELFNMINLKQDIKTVNKVITPRKSTSKGGYVDYSYFDTAKRTLEGKTVERNIQWYRMWFTYLKLCIELQDKGENIKGKKLKVSKFYDEWEEDFVTWDRGIKKSLLNVSFDEWWVEKKHLFELPKIESGNNNNDDYFVVSVPLNRTKQDLVREFDDYLKVNKTKFTNKAKYPFSKSIIPFIRLHIQYNCLVMHYNDIRIKEMMNWCNDKYSDIRGVIQNKEMSEQVVFGYEQSVTRVISKGKDRLLDVCRGIFP